MNTLQASRGKFDGVPDKYKGAPVTWCWQYLDRTGTEALGIVARYDRPDRSKDVIPYFKLEAGRWTAGHAAESGRALYGLHSLQSCGVVYVVEGEKCAAALHRLGMPAVTNPGGSKAAHLADWTPLDGCQRAIILPDNDTPGEVYLQAVAGILAALPHPPEVHRLDLPDLPNKGDVVDWIQARVPGWDGYTTIAQGPGRLAELRAELEAYELRPVEIIPGRSAKVNTLQRRSAWTGETICLADVAPESVQWWWYGYLPKGKLVIMDGDPCVGKSTMTLDWVARLTKGEPFPRSADMHPPCNVLFLYQEDGLGDTMRPRLDAAVADVSRVFAMKPGHFPQLPDAFEWIKETIENLSVSVVVIDPIMALLGGQDTNNDAKSRNVLTPLMGLAESTGATIVCIRHLTKGTGRKAIHAGGGSIAFTSAARVTLTAARAPDDSGRCVLAVAKCNVAPMQASIFYEITGVDGAPRIEWGEEAPYTADDLMPQERKPTGKGGAKDAAMEFLTCELSDGAVFATEINRRASLAGISVSSLRRAADALRIVKSKSGFDGGAWVWQLPE